MSTDQTTPTITRRSLLGSAAGLSAAGAFALALGTGAPVASAATSRTRARLNTTMTAMLKNVDMSLLVYDWRTHTWWGYRQDRGYSLGSCVKVPTAISMSRVARSQGRGLSATEMSMITRALRVSDNNAQQWVWDHSGQWAGFNTTARWLHLGSVTQPAWGRGWGRSYSTAYDMVEVMKHVVGPNAPANYTDMRWIARTMETSASDQIWGVGAMGRPAGLHVGVKDGWVPLDGHWRINSIGHICGNGLNYSAAILSQGWKSFTTTKINQVGYELYQTMRLGPLG